MGEGKCKGRGEKDLCEVDGSAERDERGRIAEWIALFMRLVFARTWRRPSLGEEKRNDTRDVLMKLRGMEFMFGRRFVSFVISSNYAL